MSPAEYLSCPGIDKGWADRKSQDQERPIESHCSVYRRDPNPSSGIIFITTAFLNPAFSKAAFHCNPALMTVWRSSTGSYFQPTRRWAQQVHWSAAWGSFFLQVPTMNVIFKRQNICGAHVVGHRCKKTNAWIVSPRHKIIFRQFDQAVLQTYRNETGVCPIKLSPSFCGIGFS